jgi:carbonic anhydrase/acetyltransferase-like protein (isoleucine patch superfamily)
MTDGAIIRDYDGKSPEIDESCFIAPGAVVVGDVKIGKETSVWYTAVLRGDDNYIRIGERTNIQDGTIIHVSYETAPTVIGNGVTIGHGVRLHGCTIGDGALIGIGAIVLDGAVIEPGAFVAAGAMVTPGKVVKSGELWGGSPAKKLRDLKEADREYMSWDADWYVKVAEKSK